MKSNKSKNKSKKKPSSSGSSSARGRTVEKKGAGWCCSSWACLLMSAFLVAGLGVVVLVPGPIDAITVDLHPYEDTPDNEVLKSAVKLFEGELVGPEAFAVDSEGNMFTGLSDGRIVQFNDTTYTTVVRMGLPPYNNCGSPSFQEPCGRPLGMEFDPKNKDILYIAESYHGIYQYNLQTEELKLIVNTTNPPEGIPNMKFINDLIVLENGSIFFTDTSSRFPCSEFVKEVYESRPTGKLLHYNPKEDSLYLVLSNLAYANGIYLSRNKEFLLISETTACRIIKYYLAGPKAGTTEPFIKGLPGVPDNISPSSSGGLWVGFGLSRQNGMFDLISRLPLVRNLVVKAGLENFMVANSPNDGLIIEYNEQGEKVRGLYDNGAQTIHGVSEVLDLGTKLYLGSINAPFLAKISFKN